MDFIKRNRKVLIVLAILLLGLSLFKLNDNNNDVSSLSLCVKEGNKVYVVENDRKIDNCEPTNDLSNLTASNVKSAVDSANFQGQVEAPVNSDTVANATDGAQGDRGLAGTNGSNGASGSNGVNGVDGDDGQDGANGVDGAQGPQGPQGDTGATGAQGPQGDKGDQGDQGVQGDQGPQGIQGLMGLKGDQGEVGPQGIQGIPGAIGAKGDQGDQGVQGITGIQGLMGAMGLQGPKGDQGDQGPQGIAGIQGIQGIAGPQGLQGIQGPSGPSGSTLVVGTPVGSGNNPSADTKITATATCAIGKVVYGGGVMLSNTGQAGRVAVQSSYPSSTTTWSGIAVATQNVTSNNSFTVTAYALCSL